MTSRSKVGVSVSTVDVMNRTPCGQVSGNQYRCYNQCITLASITIVPTMHSFKARNTYTCTHIKLTRERKEKHNPSYKRISKINKYVSHAVKPPDKSANSLKMLLKVMHK